MLAIPLIGKDAGRHAKEQDIMMQNFLIYRDAVREYMAKNPGYDGTIGSSALDLSPTFNNLGGWDNRVESGTAWVYGDVPIGGLRHGVEKMDHPHNLGIKRGGELYSPIYGNTGISVPGFVSDGQVVAVIKNI